MDNLEASFEEHQKIERIKKIFKQYGNLILIVLLILIASVSGWQYWQHHKIVQSDEASQVYLQLLDAMNKSDEGNKQAIANELIQHYPATPYAKIAAFALAQNAVRSHKLDLAITQLNWVIQHPDQLFLSDLAKIRLAQILLSQQKAQAALETLSGAQKIYPAETAMLKGQALAALGHTDLAKAEFQKALDATPAEVSMRPVLQMYLNDL